MRNRLCLMLASWPFVCMLAVLLLNDWWLKSAHPGFITGKLSDFAGLSVVGLPLLAVWPDHERKICLVLAGLFMWWKSSLSDAFIELVNACAPVSIGRTVDYGDLIALITLPACCYLVRHHQPFALPWPAFRKILFIPLVLATAFATMATSLAPIRQDYEIRRTGSAQELQRERVHEAIALVAERHGLVCEECPRPDGAMVYIDGTRTLTMRYLFPSADVVAFAIEARGGRDTVDKLQSDLKAEFAKRFKGLEFVQHLKPSY